ncbi:MAG TPA: hypothetical protein VF328_19635 [Mycobacterium sp.]
MVGHAPGDGEHGIYDGSELARGFDAACHPIGFDAGIVDVPQRRARETRPRL